MARPLSPVGKNVGGNLYVHRSAEQYLPEELAGILDAAKQEIERDDYDLVKFDLKDVHSGMSFLWYEDFENQRHPALLASVRVTPGGVKMRDYSAVANPPILHRKETFVGPQHPNYERFRRETEEEEDLGLLNRPPGYLRQWEEFVQARVEPHVARRILRR